MGGWTLCDPKSFLCHEITQFPSLAKRTFAKSLVYNLFSFLFFFIFFLFSSEFCFFTKSSGFIIVWTPISTRSPWFGNTYNSSLPLLTSSPYFLGFKSIAN